MSSVFLSGFESMVEALARIFIIIVVAGFLVRKNVITQNHIDALSKVTVVVLLPSLVFSNTLQHFNPSSLPYWWLLPVAGVFMSVVGLLFAAGVFITDLGKQRNLIAVASMQNAGYLVLPIGQVVYPEHFTEFALITFLFILGYNPFLWSVGTYLVTSSERPSFDIKKIITPPAVANIISLILVLSGTGDIFPSVLVDSIDLTGQAAVPVATFVLGATLGSESLKHLPGLRDIIRVVSVKYVLLPLFTVAVLYYFDIGKSHPLLADFFIIQAAAAPATGLILQVRAYGGDVHKIAGMMIVAYLICLLALPFWIAFWHSLSI